MKHLAMLSLTAVTLIFLGVLYGDLIPNALNARDTLINLLAVLMAVIAGPAVALGLYTVATTLYRKKESKE